jgi:hypothetical protein
VERVGEQVGAVIAVIISLVLLAYLHLLPVKQDQLQAGQEQPQLPYFYLVAVEVHLLLQEVEVLFLLTMDTPQ